MSCRVSCRLGHSLCTPFLDVAGTEVDYDFHYKRVPADARNSQAPDHCGHNNPPTYPSKEEQRRSCFSNQERKVENLHEWAIEVKAMGGKAVDSYHWRSNDFHVVPCDECLIVSDFLRNAVWDNQEKVFTPKRERHPYCKSPGNQPAILLVTASGISAVLMLPYRQLSPCSPGCRYS